MNLLAIVLHYSEEEYTLLQQCRERLKKCKYFDFFILLPKFHSLKQQTVTRVKDFIDSVQKMSSLSSSSELSKKSSSEDQGKVTKLDFLAIAGKTLFF